MIRPATVNDADEIATIWNWMIAETLLTFTSERKTVEAVRKTIASRTGAFLVSEGAHGIEGFATFGTFRSGPGYARTCEHSVIVAPAHVGRGIGYALMEPLFERAKQSGCHVMVAAISGANPRAVVFHDKLGFSETGRLPEVGYKNGQYLDLILMQKML